MAVSNGWLFPTGSKRPMLQRGIVIHFRKRRIFDATARVVARQGYSATTMHHLTKEAQTGRNTLYETFGNREEIFLGAFDEAAEALLRKVKEAVGAEVDWRRKVEASLSVVLDRVASNPLGSQAFMVEPLRGIAPVKQRYREFLYEFVSLAEEVLPRDERLPSATSEMLVGGVAAIINQHISRGEAEAAAELLPELNRFVLELFDSVGLTG